jgi:8-amino-7-oxononanoate synthase
VTDSLFSVDGDFAPLRKLAALKKKRGARADDTLLVVDEAHATLAMGATGAGAAEAMGVDPADVDVSIGTLSKAFGSHGGFAATSRAMKSFLLSRARAQVFSTALPAPCVEAAAASLEVSNGEEGRALRKRLWANVATLNEALVAGSTGTGGARDEAERRRERLPPEEFFFDDGKRFFSRSNDAFGSSASAPPGGYDGYASRRVVVGSPIAALRVGGGFSDGSLGSSEAEALRCSRALLERHGAHVVALRPPTVPAGTSRIRVALSAAHSDEDVRALVAGLRDVGFGGAAGRAKM